MSHTKEESVAIVNAVLNELNASGLTLHDIIEGSLIFSAAGLLSRGKGMTDLPRINDAIKSLFNRSFIYMLSNSDKCCVNSMKSITCIDEIPEMDDDLRDLFRSYKPQGYQTS